MTNAKVWACACGITNNPGHAERCGCGRYRGARLGYSMVLHVLRNPHGHSQETQRAARVEAADRMEELQAAYLNMREWAEQNGLSTVACGNPAVTNGVGEVSRG